MQGTSQKSCPPVVHGSVQHMISCNLISFPRRIKRYPNIPRVLYQCVKWQLCRAAKGAIVKFFTHILWLLSVQVEEAKGPWGVQLLFKQGESHKNARAHSIFPQYPRAGLPSTLTQLDVSIFKQTRNQSHVWQELLFIHRFTEYIELRGISFVNSIYQKKLNVYSALKCIHCSLYTAKFTFIYIYSYFAYVMHLKYIKMIPNGILAYFYHWSYSFLIVKGIDGESIVSLLEKR